MRNKLIKLVSRSTRCRLFWDHFKTCWDVCGAFEDINLDKLNHKHNNEALSLFQFWDIPTMFGTFWDVSGQVFGHETFVFLGHFGTFRDISKTKIFGIRSGNHSGGPSIEANWPTEPGTFVWRMAISKHFGTYFGTCWDISGHPLSMCTNDRSSIQPRRAFYGCFSEGGRGPWGRGPVESVPLWKKLWNKILRVKACNLAWWLETSRAFGCKKQ